MKSLDFYNVNPEYVNYLRSFEENVRGFSHVPYVNYGEQNRKEKFFCGIVLRINDMPYYVPVSSNIRESPHSFYLFEGNRRISSLRFGYMFPVPQQLVTRRNIQQEPDHQYKQLLSTELDFCRKHESTIREYALRTYTEVVAIQDEQMRSHSCNFRVLEGACEQYCREHGLSLDPQQAPAAPRTLAELCADAKAKAAEANARQTAPPRRAPEHTCE